MEYFYSDVNGDACSIEISDLLYNRAYEHTKNTLNEDIDLILSFALVRELMPELDDKTYDKIRNEIRRDFIHDLVQRQVPDMAW